MQKYSFPASLFMDSLPLRNCLERTEYDVTGLYIIFGNANVLYVCNSFKSRQNDCAPASRGQT
ncbi:hypothetical protein BSK56_13795 [Paenibacillus borealis]|uniref:Uncharacterized protein n=1 Tax=Paenibacillus borealis TaxID=160799 RepID=A0ABX3HB74_PAEBO|nr:hypothetical protein BSK56_13795 [Paenibacillus borealis]